MEGYQHWKRDRLKTRVDSLFSSSFTEFYNHCNLPQSGKFGPKGECGGVDGDVPASGAGGGRKTVSVGLRGNAGSGPRKQFLLSKGIAEGTPEFDAALHGKKGTRISVAKAGIPVTVTAPEPAKVAAPAPTPAPAVKAPEVSTPTAPAAAPVKKLKGDELPGRKLSVSHAKYIKDQVSILRSLRADNVYSEQEVMDRIEEEAKAEDAKGYFNAGAAWRAENAKGLARKAIEDAKRPSMEQAAATPRVVHQGDLLKAASTNLADMAVKERESVLHYQQAEGEYNAHLREGGAVTQDIRDLDHAMARSTTGEKITGSRGMYGEFNRRVQLMKIGEEFTDNGYTSISGTNKTADQFSTGPEEGVHSSTVYRMVIPKGSHAIAIGGGDVQEILVNRGATWRKVGANALMLVREGAGPQ